MASPIRWQRNEHCFVRKLRHLKNIRPCWGGISRMNLPQ